MTMTIFRTLILYILVIIGLRLMGKRQIGDMQPTELVVTILISELAAIPMQDLNRPLVNGIVAIFSLVTLELILSFLIMKSNNFRRVLTGRAAIIIKNGVIDQKLMKAMRFTTEDLMEDLRQQSVFNLDEVAFAIVETNGKLSVLKKPEKQTPTLSDLNLSAPYNGLPSVLVSDGKIMKESLQITGFQRERIEKLLAEKHLPMSEVFIMTGDAAGNYLIIGKENSPKN